MGLPLSGARPAGFPPAGPCPRALGRAPRAAPSFLNGAQRPGAWLRILAPGLTREAAANPLRSAPRCPRLAGALSSAWPGAEEPRPRGCCSPCLRGVAAPLGESLLPSPRLLQPSSRGGLHPPRALLLPRTPRPAVHKDPVLGGGVRPSSVGGRGGLSDRRSGGSRGLPGTAQPKHLCFGEKPSPKSSFLGVRDE